MRDFIDRHYWGITITSLTMFFALSALLTMRFFSADSKMQYFFADCTKQALGALFILANVSKMAGAPGTNGAGTSITTDTHTETKTPPDAIILPVETTPIIPLSSPNVVAPGVKIFR